MAVVRVRMVTGDNKVYCNCYCQKSFLDDQVAKEK